MDGSWNLVSLYWMFKVPSNLLLLFYVLGLFIDYKAHKNGLKKPKMRRVRSLKGVSNDVFLSVLHSSRDVFFQRHKKMCSTNDDAQCLYATVLFRFNITSKISTPNLYYFCWPVSLLFFGILYGRETPSSCGTCVLPRKATSQQEKRASDCLQVVNALLQISTR